MTKCKSSSPHVNIVHHGIKYEIDQATGGVLIPLGGRKHVGFTALIDADDLELVGAFRWSVWRRGDQTYAISRSIDPSKEVKMHRVILGLTDPKVEGDHVNGSGLDNRRCNLRIVSHMQNMWNRRAHRDSTSLFKGVSWNSASSCWVAVILARGKRHFLGRFQLEIEAARAYDAVARELHGEFACLNFPDEEAS